MHLKKIFNKNMYMLIFVLLLLLCACNNRAGNTLEKEPPNEINSFALYRNFSGLTFEQDGNKLVLAEENPGVLVLAYWASWCPHCESLISQADNLAAIANEEGARFVLVNKLDGEKETESKAAAYLDEKGISAENWYDNGLSSYNALCLDMIPSVLVFDSENRLMGFNKGGVPTDEELRSIIRNALYGNDERLMLYIENNLLQNDGGVISGDNASVLSESQGLIMQAALLSEDSALFEDAYYYFSNHRTEAGLASWVDNSPVNALLDDLRIYNAMAGYGVDKNVLFEYSGNIYDANTKNYYPVDFYNASNGEKANRFTLCYADFETMELLAENDKQWKKVLNNALIIVEGGKISNDFPLYHSYYDYGSKEYKSEDLHMAEALVTLLNLSKYNRLPNEALTWLETQMNEGYIYSIYDINGRPAKNGRFESTAVYALIVNIALSENKTELALKAVTRMEELRVKDSNSVTDGAFGNSDNTGIFSFDQLTALLAYQELGGISR